MSDIDISIYLTSNTNLSSAGAGGWGLESLFPGLLEVSWGLVKECGAPVGFRFGGQLLCLVLGIFPNGINLFLLLVLGVFKLSLELALTSRFVTCCDSLFLFYATVMLELFHASFIDSCN